MRTVEQQLKQIMLELAAYLIQFHWTSSNERFIGKNDDVCNAFLSTDFFKE